MKRKRYSILGIMASGTAEHEVLQVDTNPQPIAERLAKVLASSRYATDLLLRAPEAVAMLGDDVELVPRGRAEPQPTSFPAT